MGKNILTLSAAGLLCGLMAYAQSPVSTADRTFMDKAAEGGLAEVQLGQLAEQKASSQSVKDFGKRMVTDHSQANDKLKTIASSKSVTLPTSLTAKDKALYDRLNAMSGASFDKAYMTAMVKDHKTDVAEFQREAQKAKDSDVKSFASMTLPTLQDHLRTAEQVESGLTSKAAKTTAQR